MTVDSPRCSVVSGALEEPLAATAPLARAWLVLEQPGPWGPKALLASRLPAGLGPLLAEASADTGTTVVLARRPGRHADDHGEMRAPPRFWVAHTAPGQVSLRSGTLEDPRTLADWDLAALAAGDLPPVGVPDLRPVLFVCTNGRRDLCCALAGRDLVDDLADDPALRDRVWEVSHLGGHRFAPTVLLLPTGAVYGRLDPESARDVLARADEGVLARTGYRGRTALPRPAQAAEIAVRDVAGVAGLDDLVTRPAPEGPGAPDGEQRHLVEHRDGRAWEVRVAAGELDPPRPESCGKPPVTQQAWRAVSVRPLA